MVLARFASLLGVAYLSFGGVEALVYCSEFEDYIVGQQDNETFALSCMGVITNETSGEIDLVLKSISNSEDLSPNYYNSSDVYCDWEGPRRATSTHECENIIFECYDNVLYSMKSIDTQSNCPDLIFLPYNSSGDGPVSNFESVTFHTLGGSSFEFGSENGRLLMYGLLFGENQQDQKNNIHSKKTDFMNVAIPKSLNTNCDTTNYAIGSCNWSEDEIVSDYGFDCSGSEMISVSDSSLSSGSQSDPSSCSSCDWTGPEFFKGPNDCDDVMMECYDGYFYDIMFIGDHPTFSADACKTDLQPPIDPLQGVGCNWDDSDVYMKDTDLGTSMQITCNKYGVISVFKKHS